jgi:hypothetical protein
MKTKQDSAREAAEQARAALASAEANHAAATKEAARESVGLKAATAAAIEAGVAGKVLDVDDTASTRADRRVYIAAASLAKAEQAALDADEALAVALFNEREGVYREAVASFAAALDVAAERNAALIALRIELGEIHPRLARRAPHLGWSEFEEDRRLDRWRDVANEYLHPPVAGPPKLTVLRATEGMSRARYGPPSFTHNPGEIFQVDDALAGVLVKEGLAERVTAA